MMKNKKTKKPTIGKVIAQWVISAVLVLFIWSMVIYTIGIVAEAVSDDEYRWLLGDLNDGDYADCAQSYMIQEHLGMRMGEEFEQFDEFELFYREYILCLEFKAAKESEKYQEKMQESLARMEEICKNSPYEYNIPHYEYLIESLTVVEGDNL